MSDHKVCGHCTGEELPGFVCTWFHINRRRRIGEIFIEVENRLRWRISPAEPGGWKHVLQEDNCLVYFTDMDTDGTTIYFYNGGVCIASLNPGRTWVAMRVIV